LRLAPLVGLAAAALPLSAQYAGPAILSRGQAPAAMSTPNISFRPFAAFTATYNSGLTGVGLTDQGQIANQASYGEMVAWGVSGSDAWKHTTLGLDYHGAFSHYVTKTFYDNIDESFLLGLTHQWSPHVSMSLQENAGIFSVNRPSVGLSQTIPFDPGTTSVPVTDFFDNRTMYSSSLADLVYQRTARLSFDMGAGDVLLRRRSSALADMNGAQARGDLQYRLTRFITVGALYSFSYYDYGKVATADTTVHGASGAFAYQIDRTVEFSGYAGMQRGESKFYRSTPVDPVIAALIGQTSTTQIQHAITYTPAFDFRLSKVFRRGVLFASGGRAITPGNGLFLSSITTTFIGGYTYTGLRRWSFRADMNYAHSNSFQNVEGDYSGLSGELSMSRQIAASLHFIMSYAARNYTSKRFSGYNRLINVGSVGVGFTPVDIPLRIW